MNKKSPIKADTKTIVKTALGTALKAGLKIGGFKCLLLMYGFDLAWTFLIDPVAKSKRNAKKVFKNRRDFYQQIKKIETTKDLVSAVKLAVKNNQQTKEGK